MSLLDSLSSASEPGPSERQCSRKGCRAAAAWQLLWNNPRIHTPERRKIWLACHEHEPWLENYLAERSLLREVLPLEPTAPDKDGDTR